MGKKDLTEFATPRHISLNAGRRAVIQSQESLVYRELAAGAFHGMVVNRERAKGLNILYNKLGLVAKVIVGGSIQREIDFNLAKVEACAQMGERATFKSRRLEMLSDHNMEQALRFSPLTYKQELSVYKRASREVAKRRTRASH